MTRRARLVAALLLGAAWFGRPAVALAGAGLLITPHRVVIEGREHEARVSISNAGDEPGGYRLFFINYAMDVDGGFTPVTDGAGAALDGFTRYSPRHVALAPGETQVVRISVRRPADLKPGEYRSHLVFQAVPRKGESHPVESKQGKAKASITTLYGLSIPVIYRHRAREATVRIGAVDVAPGRTAARVELLRTGDTSVYGNLRVAFRAAAGGDFKPVGESNGNAVYPPLERRFVTVPLDGAAGSGGTLRVTFETDQGATAAKDVPLE